MIPLVRLTEMTLTAAQIFGMKRLFEMPMQYPGVCFSPSSLHPEQRNEGQQDVSGTPPVYQFPYYYPGMVDHGIALHSVQNFHL